MGPILHFLHQSLRDNTEKLNKLEKRISKLAYFDKKTKE